MKSFVQRILRVCGPSEQPPPAAPPLPPLEREAPLAAPQQQPPLVRRVQAAPSQPLVPVPAPQLQPEPLVPVPAPQPQPLVPVQAPEQQLQPLVTLPAPAPAPVPHPPPPVEPLGTLLHYQWSSMKLLNDGITAYLGKLKQDPADFTRKCALEPLEEVPISKKLEAAISRRAVKGNVMAEEAAANPANRVAKGVLRGEIEQYLKHLSLEVKNVEDENFEALSEEIELVRLWVVSFKKIWFGA